MKVEDVIRSQLKELLRLDAKTMAYVYEHERGDRRFEVIDIAEGEFFMKIGPVECVEKTEDGCYVEVALTTAEAIALALKLIKYAAQAYEKWRAGNI
jgi:hypothetical protein